MHITGVRFGALFQICRYWRTEYAIRLRFTACPYKIADLSCLHVRIRYFIRIRQRKLSLSNMRNSGAKCQEGPKGVNSECFGRTVNSNCVPVALINIYSKRQSSFYFGVYCTAANGIFSLQIRAHPAGGL